MSGATLSSCRTWRYTLTRDLYTFDQVILNREVTFIGLNPSTADEAVDDPTIRRCISFAMKFGGSKMHMLNLFAYRATDPLVLWQAQRDGIDIIGEDNDWHLRKCLSHSDIVICAWGANASRHESRVRTVLDMIEEPFCLGMTADGSPRHPLYLKATQKLVPYANPY